MQRGRKQIPRQTIVGKMVLEVVLNSFVWFFSELRKQLDTRWKQIDRFETSVKNLAEIKHSWRRKYNAKEGELEAVKVSSRVLGPRVGGSIPSRPQMASFLLRYLLYGDTHKVTNQNFVPLLHALPMRSGAWSMLKTS